MKDMEGFPKCKPTYKQCSDKENQRQVHTANTQAQLRHNDLHFFFSRC